MSGTNSTDTGQSATNTADTFDENALIRAIHAGDHAEIDRLMAAGAGETKETEEETDKEEAVSKEDTSNTEETEEESTTESSTKDETPSQEDQEKDKTEAAKSAASTATQPEELEGLKRELHQYKSDAGRVPFLQRRMAELERELRAYKARESTPTQKGNGTAASTDELDPELQKELNELKEIDPVLAKTMERVARAAMGTAKQHVDHAVTTLTESEQEAEDAKFFIEQRSILLQQVPQADAIFQSPQWRMWKERLTPNRRAMAESGYADEVITALHAFAADMQRVQAPAQTTAPVQQTTPAPAQVAATPENKEVLEARQRKIAATDTSKGSAAKKGETFDVDQAYREMYQSLAKQNHIL